MAAVAEEALTPSYPPSMLLRLLQPMPWRVKRLAARAWVQCALATEPHPADWSAMGEAGEEGEAGEGEAGEASGVPSGDGEAAVGTFAPSPLLQVRTMRMLDAEQCEVAVAEFQ